MRLCPQYGGLLERKWAQHNCVKNFIKTGCLKSSLGEGRSIKPKLMDIGIG